MKRRTIVSLFLLTATLTAGCSLPSFPSFGSNTARTPTTQWTLSGTDRSADPRSSIGPTDASPTDTGPADPAAPISFAVRMDIWAVVVPRGSVSGNEAFWKRVDENAIDPVRYDLLFKNGFRVGVARQDDWDYFKDILSRYPVRHQLNAITLTDEKTVDVSVKTDIEIQTLSFFSDDKPVELRTYDKSQNLIQLTFVPAPRRANAARVSITPVVRSTRERLEYSSVNDEKVVRYIVPERLYDLNLSVVVPFGEFLVVSPSTDTARQTSIGRNFLMVDGDAELSEVLLLIAPVRVEARETTPGKTPATPSK